MTTTRKPSPLADALVETARDLHDAGLLSTSARDKITLRHIGASVATDEAEEILTPAEIRSLRLGTRMSQAVFARHLKLTPGYVSQLERGAKRPSGPALVLLNLIRRKGIEAIL